MAGAVVGAEGNDHGVRHGPLLGEDALDPRQRKVGAAGMVQRNAPDRVVRYGDALGCCGSLQHERPSLLWVRQPSALGDRVPEHPDSLGRARERGGLDALATAPASTRADDPAIRERRLRTWVVKVLAVLVGGRRPASPVGTRRTECSCLLYTS